MVTRKRGKQSRYRGSHTHGFGSMKKHRGSGNKGGKGNAGSGKRADSKKPSFWKDKKYFGKYGFFPIQRKLISCVNFNELQLQLADLVEGKKATVVNHVYTINLTELGYDKLLATGKIGHKLHITVELASAKAIEKVKAAGGDVTLSGSVSSDAADEEVADEKADSDETEE